MDNNELILELLQAINTDTQELRDRSRQKPTAEKAPDYGPKLNQIAESVEKLRQQPQTSPPPQAVDTSADLKRIEQAIIQRPEYRMSQYMKYVAGSFGLMVALLVASVWFGLNWRSERDAFEVSDWKWRAVRQGMPEYATKMDNSWGDDSTGIRNRKWVLDQEQADATRLAAQKAAQRATEMNASADKLEGKPVPKPPK